MVSEERGNTPYLSLSVSQAACLPQPAAPEPSNHQTFTNLLKHRAEHQGSSIAVGFPQLKVEECLNYTYSQLLTASHDVAAHLWNQFPTNCANDSRQPVIAILGPSGPDFLLHVIACWLLGAAILPIALGTPASGAAKLIKTCKCDAVLFANVHSEIAKEIQQELSEAKFDTAKYIEWMQTRQTNRHLKGNLLHSVRNIDASDTLVIFHSSGSSGNPKPLAQLHRFWSNSLLIAPGRQFAAYTTTPLFHGGLSDFFRSVQAGASLYFYPWHLQVAPTSENILDSIANSNQEICYFLSVPFILELLLKSKKGIEVLKKMHLVSTGGAPLPEAIGDQAVQEYNIKLVSRLGSSECGFLMSSFRDFSNDKDWSWFRLPDELGQSLLCFHSFPDTEGNLFELVVSSKWPTKQLSNLPDGSFATGDLYERHSQYHNRWRYKRRADDNIVMINGKKIAASMIETYLCESPIIEDAIVFGANRPLLGAIIFSSQSDDDILIRRNIQRHLLALNRRLPRHGRIAIEMVHIGNEELRSHLPRSSKGTLQKGLALEKLSKLIDDMYESFEKGEAPSTEKKKKRSGDDLICWLQQKVEEISDQRIDLKDDFYQSGIDSIMAAKIRAAIHQGLLLDNFKLEASDIYNHPNVLLLSRYIESRGETFDSDRDELMKEMVEKYSQFTKLKAKDDAYETKGGSVIILTGATGALGCRILDELVRRLKQTDITKIICIVRANDSAAAKKRINLALDEKLLAVPDTKWDCVTNLWELSMNKDIVQAGKVIIIHSAWIVNFALQVESFEQDCISSLKDLLDFFRSCSNAHQFIFCSSLASILSGHSPYLEQSSMSLSDSGQTGYGQSKWIAEKICENAGSNVIIARIGQLCGDTKQGIWNSSEAWPLMIRTAQEIGSLPSTGPAIDWLPVDVAAAGIVDIALSSLSFKSPFLHVALPPKVERPSWTTFVRWLQDGGLQFETIPKSDWLEIVKVKRNQIRGSALIDIWENIPEEDSNTGNVDMQYCMSQSQTISMTRAVSKELTMQMIKAWRSSGFLLP